MYSTSLQLSWQVGFVASFVSKFSDTVSSEIGKVGLLNPLALMHVKVAVVVLSEQ